MEPKHTHMLDKGNKKQKKLTHQGSKNIIMDLHTGNVSSTQGSSLDSDEPWCAEFFSFLKCVVLLTKKK